jgi:hypothetical protein
MGCLQSKDGEGMIAACNRDSTGPSRKKGELGSETKFAADGSQGGMNGEK